MAQAAEACETGSPLGHRCMLRSISCWFYILQEHHILEICIDLLRYSTDECELVPLGRCR